MVHRVVITGVGAVTPLGMGARVSFDNLLAGKCGLTDILKLSDWRSLHDTVGSLSLNMANAVTQIPQNTQSLQARTRLPRAFTFAELAAEEALKDSGVSGNVGIYLGSGLPGATELYENYNLISQVFTFYTVHSLHFCFKGKRVSPYLISAILGNSPAGHVARKFRLNGPTSSPSMACATGSYAIGEAFRFLRDELEIGCDALLAGATETPINAPSLAGFKSLRALSSTQISRPFDRDRDGFVLGEGAGIVVLERLCSALKRNAKIYAEIIGFGCSSDAFHPTAPDPSNKAAITAINTALLQTQQDHSIVAINAHATSTPIGDSLEVKALESALNSSHHNKIFLTSNKGAIGHLLGAAGAVESVFTTLSLFHKIIPPNTNLTAKISTKFILPTDSPTIIPSTTPNPSILKTSFGFGGVNTALLFKSF